MLSQWLLLQAGLLLYLLLTAMPNLPLQEKPEHLLRLLLSYRLQLP